MDKKPTYKELEQRIKELESQTVFYKQTKEELIKSEKKFRYFVETMVDMVWTTDLEFKTTYVSPSIENTLGFTAEERYKQTAEEMMTPISLQKANEALLRILKQQENGFSYEKLILLDIEFYKKDGSTIWLENSVKFINDSDNKIIGLIGVSRDVTRRRELEETLRINEIWMRGIFEALDESVLVVTPDRKLSNVNPATTRIFGYLENELINQSTEILHVNHDHYVEVGRLINKSFKKNESAHFEFKARRKNGEVFPSEHTISQLKNNSGEPIGIVSIIRDVTERIQADQVLKNSRLQLETVYNNINSSIYIADMKSNEILLMNDHMKKLFGEDLTGKICWKTIHKSANGPCDFCKNGKLIDGDGNPAEPHVKEVYNQKLKKWFEQHNLAVPWIDGDLVCMEISIDITDRKLNELKQNEINEILEDKIKERTSDLEDVNTALRVMLTKREEDKNQIGENIYANFKSIILPLLYQLRKSHTKNVKNDILEILETNIKEMVTPFSKKLSDPMVGLTPTEIQVANLVKEGKTNKETAQILNKSLRTISAHRENIRKNLI